VSTRPEQLRDRTKAFAIRIVRLYRSLPKTSEAQGSGKAATSLWDVGCGKLSSGLSRSI